jgi:predicted nucleic acid-binding Zn ribbon protein
MSDETKINFRCPECDREIINRAVDLCLYCGAPIPEELQFTSDEIEENDKKHMKKVEEAEKDRRKRRGQSTGGVDLFEPY